MIAVHRRDSVPTRSGVDNAITKNTEKFQTHLRARDTPAGSGELPASFSMGLSLGLPLSGCLNSVAPLAQRLKIFSVVGAGRQGHDVVNEDGCGDAASFGTMAA